MTQPEKARKSLPKETEKPKPVMEENVKQPDIAAAEIGTDELLKEIEGEEKKKVGQLPER